MRIFMLCCLFPLQLLAQFQDDFSDGDFAQNPTWAGSDAHFVVNENFQLQLDAPPETAVAYLSTESSMINDTEWQFYFDINTDPSSSNFIKIYLVSDNADLNGELNGYFIRVGESGTDDGIDFYRQTGLEEELIWSSVDIDASSKPLMRMKVRRTAAGQWQFFVDPLGGEAFQEVGNVTDDIHQTTTHFGVWVSFTSTKNDDYTFDDFYVGEWVIDNEGPELIDLVRVSSTELDLYFSEPVTLELAQNTANYTLSGGVGNPSLAFVDIGNPTLVHLVFDDTFPANTPLILTVLEIEDFSGNRSTELRKSFIYSRSGRYDVLITEIMANPKDAPALPEAEYIELYNATDNPIDLLGWQIDGIVITNGTIAAGEYAVLVDSDSLDVFSGYGNAIGLAAISITNDGENIVLTDAEGELIHNVDFNTSWYLNSSKDDGGWSLEMIDTSTPCGGAANWAASNDVRGGTPGAQNSIAGSNPDTEGPVLAAAATLNSNQIILYFNETLDEVIATNPALFEVDGGIGTPATVEINNSAITQLVLTFPNEFEEGVMYTITVQQLTDCVGNVLESGETMFGMASMAQELDIVINEIVHDAFPFGPRYIELYNRSEKIIDLSFLLMAEVDLFLPIVVNDVVPIATQARQLLPDEYIVLTDAPNLMPVFYPNTLEDVVLEVDELPLTSQLLREGHLAIVDTNNVRIDEVRYSMDWHYALVDIVDGVALERISPEVLSQEASSWHSASSTVGYGTPGFKNSQFFEHESVSERFSVSPEVFSPDQDGFKDFLLIDYQLDEPGFTANVRIYDDRGREVRHLVNNELLGSSGTYKWDGSTDENEKAPIGIYLIHIELFDLNGNIEREVFSAVLGGKLE